MNAARVLCLGVAFLAGCGLGPDMTRDRIPRTPSPTPWQGERPIQEYLVEADSAFAAGDHASAITSYKRALEIEQRQPQLDKKIWYALVSNLATSYARSGDVGNARVVIAYGLSKDYSYPLFHYTLARTYAEEGNEAEALHHLRNAFKNRKKVTAGEKFPDPLTDASFASMADSDTFKKAVADMKRGG